MGMGEPFRGYAWSSHETWRCVVGVIRKTASVGTLGMVNFRSKKEKLRRAEQSLAAGTRGA